MSAHDGSIDRREAIRRVGVLLGGIGLVGGSGLVDAIERGAHGRAALLAQSGQGVGPFSAADVALLDEIADTMLPATKTPGAKAAKVGPFIAVMVNDTYDAREQQIFHTGLRTLNDQSRKQNGVDFMRATPAQRLSLLQRLDHEQKTYMDARDAAKKGKNVVLAGKRADAYVSDQRKENAPGPDVNPAPAVAADSPTHYFRMMKELALLGYFTSEIGCTQAQRYVESPGKFEPCVPYTPGERAWAGHA
jgi:hypothetical protein